jgi:hypothetical protein
MKALNFRTIFVALFLALLCSHLIVFLHTLLDMLTQIRLKIPLTAYLFWGYLPMIVSGIYIGVSRTKKTVLIGALVGGLFYVILWFISHIWMPLPRFDHSFKPLSFGFGLVGTGFVCSIVAWLTHTVLKRRNREIN